MNYEKSIGAIVYNHGKFLILQYGLGHWDYVKGNVEKGETDEQVVKRELWEETGIKNYELVPGFKEKISYFYKKEGETVMKTVVFYLLKTEEDRVRLSFEHKAYVWLEYDDALKKVTYDNAKKVLAKAKKYLTSSD